MTNYDKMYQLLVSKGMQSKIAKLFIKKFKIDEKSYSCSESDKEWAMTKGFFPSRIDLYGLNEDNYKLYMPDYVDYRLHPYNNHFVIWINDKLSLKYTLGSDFKDIMPEYYLYIENNGEYTYLQDAPDNIVKDKDFILNLLIDKKILIIKPNSSTSGGEGVMKVEYIPSAENPINHNGDYSKCAVKINNNRILSIEDFQVLLGGLKNNIVTEYAHQHSRLQRIWSYSECTLRIIMVKLPHEAFYSDPKWKCIVSYARFGTSLTGGASNLSSGGIGIGFDFETGKYNSSGIRYRQFCPDGDWHCYEHPDTHVVWSEECLPNWNYVRDTLYRVCNHFGSLSHLGFDVIITEKGFVLCEINSKPALNYEQVMCGPVMLSEDNISYFKKKGFYSIDRTELYSIYKDSQE